MNLTPEQWALVQPLLAPPPSLGRLGRPPLDQRLVLEGILHKLVTRTPWKQIPPTYAGWQTCYQQYLAWKENGVLRRVIRALLDDVATRGNFNLHRAVKEHLVTIKKQGRRIRIYYSASLPLNWQLSTALLYYQYTAALTEEKCKLTDSSDPLVEVLGLDL